MSYLRPFEVINGLKSNYGIEIKSTQALNKILLEMGIVIKKFNIWYFTDRGEKFTPFKSGSDRIHGFFPEIVPYIASYIIQRRK